MTSTTRSSESATCAIGVSSSVPYTLREQVGVETVAAHRHDELPGVVVEQQAGALHRRQRGSSASQSRS